VTDGDGVKRTGAPVIERRKCSASSWTDDEYSTTADRDIARDADSSYLRGAKPKEIDHL
jgi:hypothetical protein